MDRSARCLYCDTVTGVSDRPARKTVCNACRLSDKRDEGREVAAGMRPWVRPLAFFTVGKPLADDVAAEHQAFLDAEQAAIRARRPSTEALSHLAAGIENRLAGSVASASVDSLREE